MKNTLLLAIAISVFVTCKTWSDDWKDESGKGRKHWNEQFEKHHEKAWEQEKKFREHQLERAEKAREQWLKEQEHLRKAIEKAAERERELYQHHHQTNGYGYYPPGPVYPRVPQYDFYNTPGYTAPGWNGASENYLPSPNAGYHYGNSYPPPQAYGYQAGPPGYAVLGPYSPYYSPYPVPNRGAEKGARIGARIGEIIGGAEGAAVGAQIGGEIGHEVDRP